MEWVEVRAENIEAAEELALDQLGVAREDAEFEVVTREENRLFGLKKTEARVRERVKPADLPSKTTNNRKRSKNNNKTQKSNKTAPKNTKKSNKNNTGTRSIDLQINDVVIKEGYWLYGDQNGILVSSEKLAQ